MTPMRPAITGTTSGMFDATLQAGYFPLPPPCALTLPQAPCQGSTLQSSTRIFPGTTAGMAPSCSIPDALVPPHGSDQNVFRALTSSTGRCQLRSTRVLETRVCASKRLAQYQWTQRTVDPPGLIPLHLRGVVRSAPRAEPHANISASRPA